jgi:cell division protein FtsB
MGFFKAEGLISGWVGKIRNNLYFRITRQCILEMLIYFKIFNIITLLLLAQITRDEFMDFKRQVEVQFAEIKGEIKELRSQIQALNQRIDDLRKDNENIRNDIRNQMIFFGTLFVGILGVLITFLIS